MEHLVFGFLHGDHLGVDIIVEFSLQVCHAYSALDVRIEFVEGFIHDKLSVGLEALTQHFLRIWKIITFLMPYFAKKEFENARIEEKGSA